MVHYYKKYSLPYDEYNSHHKSILNKEFEDIVIIIIIKFIIIIFTFLAWFYCKFIPEFQKNILFSEETCFVFRQIGEIEQNINDSNVVKYFQGEGSLIKIMQIINKNIDFFNKWKILFLDTIQFNLDINFFVFSFILMYYS